MAAFYYDSTEECLIANDPIEDCPWGAMSRSETLRANDRLMRKIRRRQVDTFVTDANLKTRRRHVQEE